MYICTYVQHEMNVIIVVYITIEGYLPYFLLTMLSRVSYRIFGFGGRGNLCNEVPQY